MEAIPSARELPMELRFHSLTVTFPQYLLFFFRKLSSQECDCEVEAATESSAFADGRYPLYILGLDGYGENLWAIERARCGARDVEHVAPRNRVDPAGHVDRAS